MKLRFVNLVDNSLLAFAAILSPMFAATIAHPIARIPRYGNKMAKALCVLTSYATLVLVLALVYVVVRTGYIKCSALAIPLPTGPISMDLYVDYLALIPALLSSLFCALALTYNMNYLSPWNRAYKIGFEFNRSYSFVLLFIGAMNGALFSNNLLMLVIFWDLISICSYVLITFWKEDLFCLWAGMKCIIMTHIGGMTLLLATIMLYSMTGTFEILELSQRVPLGHPVLSAIVLFLLIAALPKAVQFPLHTWLPDGTVAPTSATVLFHVCGLQTGIYLIVRFFFHVFYNHVVLAPILPKPSVFGAISFWSFIVTFIGAITIIIAALNGLVEADFKRIVAYCTISQLGYIMMTIGLMTPIGVAAGLSLMMSHTSSFALLFFCAGAVIYQTGKHNINEMGGLYKHMPITATCCTIGVLALSMMPLLGIFASKYLVYHSILDIGSAFFIIIAFLGSVLNIALLIRLLHSVFMGKRSEHSLGLSIRDPPLSMIIPMIVLSTILIILGIFPQIPMNLLITPWIKQLGYQVPIIETLDVVITPLGFWEPLTVAISVAGLSILLLFAIRYFSGRIVAHGEGTVKRAEEAFEPFLCGEGINSLDSNPAYHFYHAPTHVMKIDRLCYLSDVDRPYTTLSKNFFNLCARSLRLDIKQRYFPAVLSFMIGALVMILIAILAG